MNKRFKEAHLACPCGQSSDAYAINKDGSGKCFSCGEFFPSNSSIAGVSNKKTETEETVIDTDNNENVEIVQPKGVETYEYVPYRNIDPRTLEFYGTLVKLIDGVPFSVGYPYPNGSLKGRLVSEKKFFSNGPIGAAHLFGEDRFPAGSCETITITEGENDAMALRQVLGRSHAVVSVKNAITAFGDVKARRDYLNAFKKIILFLDNDKQGREATRLITRSGLFDYQKLFRVTEDRKLKDAHAYIEEGLIQEVKDLWITARKFSPDAIINSFVDIREALKKKKDAPICEWPFKELQDRLSGLHKSEMILLKGLEKIGKTEVCRAIVHKALKETGPDVKIATIFLEEDEGTTIKGVATYELGYPVSVPTINLVSDEEIFEGYKKALGDDENKLYIHTHFSGDDEEEVIDNIRFLVSVSGCTLVILDNLTMLTTGRGDEDERLRIDRITRRLRDLVNELGFCLVLVCHVNDTGQTRGSRLPDKLANTIVFLERNVKAENINDRNVIKFTIEGARLAGSTTGPAGGAYFDPGTFKLRDVIAQDSIRLPEVN